MLGKVRQMTTPLGNGLCTDELTGASNVGRYAEQGLRTAMAHKVRGQMVVAIGRFDEGLRLPLGVSSLFQGLDTLDAVSGIDGEITMKSKALPVHS